MADFSFDVVSDWDKAELNNVFDQAQREIAGRYDFKNTPAQLEWSGEDKAGLLISGGSEWQIDAIIDIFRKKLASRGQSQKLLDISKEVSINNLKSYKQVPFKKGLDQEKSKKITNLIRDHYPKTKTRVQGQEIRIVSSKKDELQAVMQLLKKQDFDFPLSFTNFR